MNDRSWNNFLGIIACVEAIRSATEPNAARHIEASHMAWTLTIDPDLGPCWPTVECGDTRYALGHAIAEIERLRERLRAEQDDCAEAESALADAGLARCQGDGCGKWVRAALMRNDMCDDCANTEDEIGRIFGNDQRAEDEAGYNQIVRDGLRWVR